MKPLEDCRLYTFIDTAYLDGRDPAALLGCLVDGGSDVIQLRAKGWGRDDILRLAERLAPLARAADVRLVINDFPGIAAAVGAPACHLGQEDFMEGGWATAGDLRRRCGLGEAMEIGLSTHAPEQAMRAVAAVPDYIAIGPVFATPTKPGRPGVTLDYVRWAAAHVAVPWFAIGGITMANVDEVLEAGARRICVVSAVLRAPDVAGACRGFRHRIEGALRGT